MDTERKAIEAATWTYLDGLYEGDVEKLASVFHPTSALTQSWEGELRVLPRDEWFGIVRGRVSPNEAGLERDDDIVSIELVTPSMALVMVRCQMPPLYFRDLLSFLKVDGAWVIAQKVYSTEKR